jgi:hypothetical protein
MAGLVPAIHVSLHWQIDVDARHKAGHDEFSDSKFTREVGKIGAGKIYWHSGRTFTRAGTVFAWARNVSRAQAARGSCSQIVAVRGNHHALRRLQIESLACGKIHTRLRLVIAGDLRAEDCVPRKIIVARKVDHQ